MFHNTFKSVEIRIFIPEELTGYLQQLTPHFSSTLNFVGIFSLTPEGGWQDGPKIRRRCCDRNRAIDSIPTHILSCWSSLLV